MRKQHIFFIIFLFYIIGFSLLSYFYFQKKYYGILLNLNLSDFQMYTQDKKIFTNTDLSNKYYFLTFGYLHCEFICQRQMQKLMALAKKLPSENLGFLFVSLDPKRDSFDKLKTYLLGRDPRFLGLRNENVTELEKFVNQFKIQFTKEIFPTNDWNYKIHHTSFILLLHKDLSKAILYPDGLDELEKIVTDFLKFTQKTQLEFYDVSVKSK